MELRTLIPEPITPEGYEPYGDVVCAFPRGAQGKSANMGTGRRFDRVAPVHNLRPETATLNMLTFRCQPREDFPVEIAMLERHPHSTQVFIPMSCHRYLVAVALGDEKPDLSTLKVFVVSGPHGVSYKPGVWHHPMVALDGVSDFTVLVYEDDTIEDCLVSTFAESERVRVTLPAT